MLKEYEQCPHCPSPEPPMEALPQEKLLVLGSPTSPVLHPFPPQLCDKVLLEQGSKFTLAFPECPAP